MLVPARTPARLLRRGSSAREATRSQTSNGAEQRARMGVWPLSARGRPNHALLDSRQAGPLAANTRLGKPPVHLLAALAGVLDHVLVLRRRVGRPFTTWPRKKLKTKEDLLSVALVLAGSGCALARAVWAVGLAVAGVGPFLSGRCGRRGASRRRRRARWWPASSSRRGEDSFLSSFFFFQPLKMK